jgi:hypothetical protein
VSQAATTFSRQSLGGSLRCAIGFDVRLCAWMRSGRDTWQTVHALFSLDPFPPPFNPRSCRCAGCLSGPPQWRTWIVRLGARLFDLLLDRTRTQKGQLIIGNSRTAASLNTASPNTADPHKASTGNREATIPRPRPRTTSNQDVSVCTGSGSGGTLATRFSRPCPSSGADGRILPSAPASARLRAAATSAEGRRRMLHGLYGVLRGR